MVRVRFAFVIVAMLGASAAAEDWSIRSPEKWTRVDASGVFDAEQLPGPAWRYTSPDAPTDELAIVKLDFEATGTPRRLATELLARVVVTPAMRIEKREVSGPVAGDATGDLIVADGETVRRYRVLAVPNHRDHLIDAVFARCTTSRATAPVCAVALASLKLESKPSPPDIDTENAFVRPALWIFGALVVAGWIFMAARYVLRQRATKRKTPLADGEIVTLTGRVRAVDQTVSAPLSGTACVLHRSRMYLGDAKKALTEHAPFVVETASGEVLVDSAPEIDLVPSPVVPRQEKRELAFMVNRGVPEARHRDAGFDEIVIAPGATVVIRGVIRIDRDHGASGERGYRDDAPTVTRLVGTETELLAIKKTW